ncbi:MAG: cytochrome c3 family protein [Deltaproteobacteria bacterium]|nr:cytochrome c3 family protein [Candidatus Anaeroferrophillus wilburensis]MBN2889203.1 cytochrome c3 family protein [Deltaproteobacteria bacterium]
MKKFATNYCGFLALVLVLLCAFGSPMHSWAKEAAQEICLECISVGQCLECHDEISNSTFAASSHGTNACTSCHRDIYDLEKHADCEVPMQPVNCGFCHKAEAKAHTLSVHADNDVTCTDCHSNIHESQSFRGDKTKVIQMCSGCHDSGDYLESVHGKGLLAGNPDSPSCSDCHGLHDIKEQHVTDIHSDTAREAREFHTKSCQKCHADSEMMKRNNVYTLAFKTYEHDYHGKVEHLGGAAYVAGCADCHTAHKQLPTDNPESSVSPEGLVETCGACHPKANANFAKYMPHADYHDKENYPLLYWTFVAMTGLLVSTFAFFWFHTVLWLIRSYIEKNELRKQGIFVPHAHNPKVFYKRFSFLEILLHFAMMVSFIALVLSGLPLKFNHAPWAQSLADLMGGPQMAGLIHRWAAVVTFSYFGTTLLWVIYYLFIKQTGETFLQKLFGPDSLCPRKKDLDDITGMFKWFFGMGGLPRFDRWTYWEKFDFIAVFWGMFAIGFTGLMLWIPEFFSAFLPGWMFNVAIVVHSDEALLASGFIFTVHFFNTHIRPEKFPMDMVIFNGVLRGYEMEEERPEQYERLKAQGKLDQLVTKYPGVLREAIGQLLGFAGLAAGLICLLLLGWGLLG